MKRACIAALLAVAGILAADSEILGPGKYWRPRENMTFYLYDRMGGSFTLSVDVRDMNVYLEGARPAFLFLVDPNGKIVDRKFVEDDGVVKNDYVYKDGVSDLFMDFRYREYHRHNSPGGKIPGKKRSPLLDDPGKITPRAVTLSAPASSPKGTYRLAVSGCWDHWFSVTPSRKLEAGIHPGQCALYLYRDQLRKAYLYLPENTRDLAIALSEEIEPFNWEVKTPIGNVRTSKNFYNFTVIRNAPRDRVIPFEVSGRTTGAMLHLNGAPFLLCESEEAAKLFAGYEDQAVARLKKAAEKFPEEKDFFTKLTGFSACFGFRSYGDAPVKIPEKNPPWLFRSNWWDFSDAWFTYPKKPLPEAVMRDVRALMEQWALFRYTMEIGMCTNQWAKITEQLAHMAEFTGSPLIREAAAFNAKRMCTPYSLGRTNPDKDHYRSGYEPDCGEIDCAIMGEALGHDSEYNLETDAHLSAVYKVIPLPEIVSYQQKYYRFKTHFTLPRSNKIPEYTFSQTCSPTDTNFRTRYYTHKTGALVDKIHYGDLWEGKNNPEKTVWPCMETAPFTRILDNRYAFVNTGNYYAVLYLGYPFPVWQSWSASEFEGNSLKLSGWSGMGYGGWQYFPAKPGGLSAVWSPSCGPLLLSNNHNVMYTNALWGRTVSSIPAKAPNIDPHITSENACESTVSFDAATRTLIRKGVLPRTALRFTRKVVLRDREIEVELTLEADKDTKLLSLFETLPLYGENRSLSVNETPILLPDAKATPSYQSLKEMEGPVSGVKPFTASKWSLLSPEGKGMTVEFDRPYQFELAQVLKYRKEAAPMTGLSAALPCDFKAGTRFTMRYTLRIR